MSQAEALYHLQEIDLSLIRIQKRLTEISAALADNQLVTQAQQQVLAAQQTLTPLQTKARNLELEIQTNSDKIRQTDMQLYSGRVRNPKELQDMQQEIESLGRRNTDLENILLETMLKAEEAEAVLKQSQSHLQHISSQWEQEHRALLDEQEKLKSEYQTLQKKREQALQAVAPDALKTYNTLRPRKANQPVALLTSGSCSFCRVEQDMAVVSEVRRGQKLTLCSSCGRVLVYRSG